MARHKRAFGSPYPFTKPGGHWAEIRERKVTMFRAIEYTVFVDGSLLEGELFYNGREAEYPKAIEARIKQFSDGGWQKISSAESTS